MSNEQLFKDRFQAFMDQLVQEFPVFATQLGDHRFDHRLGYFDEATLRRQLAELKDELAVFQRMDTSDFSLDASIDNRSSTLSATPK